MSVPYTPPLPSQSLMPPYAQRGHIKGWFTWGHKSQVTWVQSVTVESMEVGTSHGVPSPKSLVWHDNTFGRQDLGLVLRVGRAKATPYVLYVMSLSIWNYAMLLTICCMAFSCQQMSYGLIGYYITLPSLLGKTKSSIVQIYSIV